jgi:hypothetical protein
LLGTVEMVDCVSKSNSVWFEGDYGFILKDAKPFKKPVTYEGICIIIIYKNYIFSFIHVFIIDYQIKRKIISVISKKI